MELHPLCTLFPRLEGVEFEALKADIEANGQLQPIVVHDGMILDGGNRYRACVEIGVEPQTVERDFEGHDLLSYVLSVNLHRRHLTQGQHAAIVSAATNWLEAQSHGGDRKSDQGATLHLGTVADRAAQSGASVRTQKMADKVANR
ncbi:ParB N-terminal domain-containing protein [Paraburkholderia jirisanensis]